MTSQHLTISQHANENPNRQQTFTASIFGNRVFTIVTRRASVLGKWIYRIRNHHRFRLKRDQLVVGLGVQWRPPMNNRVAILQLCVGSQCLVFQIQRASSIPQCLRRFLGDSRITFVGVRNQNDDRLLMRDYNVNVDRIFELGFLANKRVESMERLASLVLGFHGVTKLERIGRSAWDDRSLSEEQVSYACVDAFISFQIGKKLKAWKYAP